MFRTLCFLALSVTLVACSSSSKMLAGRVAGAHLPLHDSVILLGVIDGTDRAGEAVEGSGNALQTVLRGQLKAREWDVLSIETTSRRLGFAKANELRMNYMIESHVIEWHEAELEYRDEGDYCAVEFWLWDVRDETAVAYGRSAREGGTLVDVNSGTHRLVEPLVRDLIARVLDGGELDSLPEAP